MLYLCLNLYCTGKRGKKKPFFLCVSDTLRLVFTLPCGYHQQQRRKTEFLSFCPVIAVFPQLRRKSEICLSFFCVCVCEYVHRRGNCSSFAIVYPINTGKPAFYSKACFLSRGCCVLFRKKACCRRIFPESSVCTFHFHFFFYCFPVLTLSVLFFFFCSLRLPFCSFTASLSLTFFFF